MILAIVVSTILGFVLSCPIWCIIAEQRLLDELARDDNEAWSTLRETRLMQKFTGR